MNNKLEVKVPRQADGFFEKTAGKREKPHGRRG